MLDLAYLFLLLNTLSAALVILRELLRRGGYLTLPFLSSVLFLSWYLPQAWELVDYPAVDSENLARLYFMSLLCFWAMVFGWRSGLGRWHRPQVLDIPVRQLLIPVYAVSLFALAMRGLIESQPPEVKATGQWTGVITIIAFFASVGVVSMALSTLMILKKRNFATLVLFALNLTIYFPSVFIYFRRGETFEFLLAVSLGLFFVLGRTIPRTALIAFGLFGFFFVNGVGQLRALNGVDSVSGFSSIERRLPTIGEIARIDWLAVVDQSDGIQGSETMNAVVGIRAIEKTGSLTLGAQFWNRMVFAYLPGQIVGHDLKNWLMIGDNALEIARKELFFEKLSGTTSTGFLEPYQDFWFAGCLVWWLTGYVLGQLMRQALRGSLVAYSVYAATITNGIHVITHSGYFYFSQSVIMVVTIHLVFFWLRLTGWRTSRLSTHV